MLDNSLPGSLRFEGGTSRLRGNHSPRVWSYPLHKSQGAHAALQVPLEESGHQAAALTAMLGQAPIGEIPVADEHGAEKLKGGQRRDG